MSRAGARAGVGTYLRYDGETVEMVEMAATMTGNEILLKDSLGRILYVSLKDLLFSDRAAITPNEPGPGTAGMAPWVARLRQRAGGRVTGRGS
ncbi:hypothetical protein C9F11_45220 (plasmid) [Streptomyces sp. YIM 121038]|nr:hypothetical protein C9F11_45220 [Streptomyces sp. YIM 121038]